MGSSKRQTVGYHYRWVKHFGWCLPVDAVLAMKFGGVVAWLGRITQTTRLMINRPDLWGGESEQGGVVGEIDVLFGDKDQEPNDYLAEVFGPKQSGNRGILSTVFRGGRYGAFVPNPKPMAMKVERYTADWKDDVVWYPERVRVTLVSPENASFYFALDDSGSMLEMTPNGKTRLENMQDAVGQVLDFIQGNLVDGGATADVCIVRYSQGSTAMTRRGVNASDTAALKAFAAGGTGSGTHTNFASGCSHMPSFYSQGPAGARRLAFFITDGEPNNASGDPPAVVAQQARDIIDGISPPISVYGINIDLEDRTYTNIVDNTGGAAVVAGGDPGQLVDVVARVFGGQRGMNPAHMVYDAITHLKGHPVAMINDANFREAADRFYAEGIGLCTQYDSGQETPDQFIERICRVAGANCQPSRVDGLWYLDPVRDDFDPEALPLITEADIDLAGLRYEPTVPTEMANSVRVEWHDQQADEDRITPSDPALGHVRSVGGVIEQTRTYREIPGEVLAMRIARRDRTVMSVPVDRYTLPLLQRRRDLRLGQPFRLQLPSSGIGQVVVRAGKIDTGTHVEGGMTITAAQVAAHMPATVHIQPSPGEWVPPDPTPVPSPHQLAFEAPYIALAAALPPAELHALPKDTGFVSTVASRPPTGTNYVLMTAPGSNDFTEAGTFDWCPSALVVEAADCTDTEFTISGGSLLDRVAVGTWALWSDGASYLEIVRVDQIEGGLVLGRGCGDTPPVPHPAGSRIWFAGEWFGGDEQQYVGGETVQVRNLTRTSHGQLTIQDATPLSVDLDDRQARPYPPHQIRIDGDTGPPSVSMSFTVSWVHRDRLLQADQLVDSGAASIGPEPGTSYTICFYLDDVLVETVDEIEGDEYEYAGHGGDGTMRVEVSSVRDGLKSWKHSSIEFDYIGALTLAGTLPPGVVGTPYSGSLVAAGGTPPYAWSLGPGAPAEWSIDPDTGEITGTASVEDTYNFNVMVEDAGSNVAISSQAVSVSVSWTPADLEGLHAWYDADDAATLTLRLSQYVSEWADKSGNERHLVQVTEANQPDYVTDGRPRVQFSGAPENMTAVTEMMEQPFTIAMVCSTGRSVGGLLLDGLTSNNRVAIGAGNFTTYDLTLFAGSAAPLTWGGTPAPLGVYVAILNVSESEIRRDGAFVSGGFSGSNNLYGITLGCRFDSTRFLPADVHEIVICDGALAGEDLSSLESYLMDKWRL